MSIQKVTLNRSQRQRVKRIHCSDDVDNVNDDDDDDNCIVLHRVMLTEAPYMPDDVITNTTVVENQRVTLACPVRGTPRPQVTWYRKDSPVVGHRVTSEGSLVLEQATANDTSQYRCVAVNAAGNVSHTVDLMVLGTHSLTHYSRCLHSTLSTLYPVNTRQQMYA